MKQKMIEWDNRMWSWNPIDKNLLLVNDWTYDFNAALPHIENKRTAIQAGGAMGMWPYLLSQYFDKVYTFEASTDNYVHLEKNLRDVENIIHANKALGKTNTKCTVKLHDKESENAGCYYTKDDENGQMEQITIDSFVDEPIDFIQLDIEGNELNALYGAKETIEKYSPAIMLEDKKLPHSDEIGHKYREVEKYLLSIDYKVVNRVHRDIIFKR
jgi:FkbM family methyltransferase